MVGEPRAILILFRGSSYEEKTVVIIVQPKIEAAVVVVAHHVKRRSQRYINSDRGATGQCSSTGSYLCLSHMNMYEGKLSKTWRQFLDPPFSRKGVWRLWHDA